MAAKRARMKSLSPDKTRPMLFSMISLLRCTLTSILPVFSILSFPPEFEYSCKMDQVILGYNATVNAVPGDVDQHVHVGGIDYFMSGENLIEVVSTADDGETYAFYQVRVTIVDGNNYLAELDVEGCNFTKLWDPASVQTYFCDNLLHLNVGDNPQELLSSTPSNYLAVIEYTGSTSARVGLNQLGVLVTASNGFQRLYTIWFMNQEDDPLVPSDCDSAGAINDCAGMSCTDLIFSYRCD